MWPFYCLSYHRDFNEILSFPEQIAEEIDTDKIISADMSGSRLSFNESLALGLPALNSIRLFEWYM